MNEQLRELISEINDDDAGYEEVNFGQLLVICKSLIENLKKDNS